MFMNIPAPIRPWIVRPKQNPNARLRMFCFPYGGGGASIYSTWPLELPAEVDLLAVQLPGRESRIKEVPFTRIAPMVRTLAAVLEPLLIPPYVFFGHSMGALVGFELARYMRAIGRTEPVHLFVSGRVAPHIPDPDPPIHQLTQSQFVQRLRQFNGTSEEVLNHVELLNLMMPLLRADFAVDETYTYTPAPPLACPITAFGGEDDGYVSQSNLAAWQEHTLHAFTLHMFAGNHFFLRHSQRDLLRALGRELILLTQGTSEFYL